MLKQTMQKVLIVGSGLSGALCASLLKSDISHILVWDKGRGAGGRMSTSRNPKDERSTVDLGAQYISATKENFEKHHRFYDELQSAGVLSPLQCTIEGDVFPADNVKFVTPNGISSIVKHYLNKSGAKIEYNRHIKEITEENGKWNVTTDTGFSDVFDGVIITMPVPQILELKGAIRHIIDSQPDVKDKLQKVSYSSRYALGLFYEPGTKINVPWGAKYFEGDPCIRYVSVDDRKRAVETETVGPSVTVHTSTPFCIKHLDEDLDKVCTDIVLPSVLKLVPELPTPSVVKNHRWRYSQVYKGYEGSPGAITLQNRPLLVLAGDAFAKTGFDGCVDSALKAEQIIRENLQHSAGL